MRKKLPSNARKFATIISNRNKTIRPIVRQKYVNTNVVKVAATYLQLPVVVLAKNKFSITENLITVILFLSRTSVLF